MGRDLDHAYALQMCRVKENGMGEDFVVEIRACASANARKGGGRNEGRAVRGS